MVKHLTVGCLLLLFIMKNSHFQEFMHPLSIMENSHFRKFMHILEPKYLPVAKSLQHPLLLSCKRFSGRHTGQHITSTFEYQLQSPGITDMIEFIITCNAANMQSTFFDFIS